MDETYEKLKSEKTESSWEQMEDLLQIGDTVSLEHRPISYDEADKLLNSEKEIYYICIIF